MADLIGAVTKVTSNFLEINQVSIDNWGFKLFYKATTVYLILSSVLTTAKYEVKYLYIYLRKLLKKSVPDQLVKQTYYVN